MKFLATAEQLCIRTPLIKLWAGGQENFKKSRPKKLVKTNKSISRNFYEPYLVLRLRGFHFVLPPPRLLYPWKLHFREVKWRAFSCTMFWSSLSKNNNLEFKWAVMGLIAIWFLAKNDKVVIYRDKREKVRKKWKSHLKIAFSLINFAENFNFWLVRISGQGFSSFFAKFLPFSKVKFGEDIMELRKIINNWKNFGENGQNWRKLIFHLSSSIYRR